MATTQIYSSFTCESIVIANIPPNLKLGGIGNSLYVYCNDAGSNTTNTLTGSTPFLNVLGPPNVNYTASLPLTVSTDGSYGAYIVQAGDFPVEGVYQVQLVAQYDPTTTLIGNVTQLEVNFSV